MNRFFPIYFMAAGMLLPTIEARAQAGPPLGDDFIFFVNGVNTLVPNFDGTVANDPDDPTNKVMEHGFGNWSFQAFRFADPAVGVDMSQNRSDGDVLHAKIWVDPENAGDPKVRLMFEDKTDGSGADDGSADLPFRLVWTIPESMRNGQWHTVSIPLPPATYNELEAGKASGALDGLDQHWTYAGAWSSGAFGVALDELGPSTSERPELWREFEWENVQNFGVFWDNNVPGGTIRLDDVYIGAENLDLSIADDPGPAVTSVTVAPMGDMNMVTWGQVNGIAGYNVYASLAALTDIDAAGVDLVASVSADSAASVTHSIYVPHASLAPLTLNYAVTTLSGFGVENTDVSSSSASATNPDLPIQPHIAELSTAESDHLSDQLGSDSFVDIVGNGFPLDLAPFEVNQARSTLGDATEWPTNDNDLSAKVWAGYYAEFSELYLYMEVLDDDINFQAAGGNLADGWQRDGVEFGWGNYDVRDTGGSILSGSTHSDMTGGNHADYSFRIAAQGDGTRAGSQANAFVGWSLDAVPQGAGAIYDQITNGGSAVGYKMLAVIPLDQIQSLTGRQDADGPDAVVPLPTGTEVKYYPFNIALNDAPPNENRSSQLQWSIKASADGQWWNTPSQWHAVALAGLQTRTAALELSGDVTNLVLTVGGTAVQQVLPEATGGAPPYSYALSPALPAGLVFDNTARSITGVPTAAAGVAPFTYAATDSYGASDSLTFTIEVVGAVSIAETVADQSYPRTHAIAPLILPEATGGVAPIDYALTPTLLTGLSFDSATRTISGTPTEVTTAPVQFTYVASDVNGSADSVQFNLEVYSPVSADQEILPESFAVHGNYPNPFRQSTRIVFDLPSPARVSVEVIDVVGRRVLTVPPSDVGAGWEKHIEVDATSLSPGHYLYRLTVSSAEGNAVQAGHFVRFR